MNDKYFPERIWSFLDCIFFFYMCHILKRYFRISAKSATDNV